MTIAEFLGWKDRDFIFTGRNNSERINIPYTDLNGRARDLIQEYKAYDKINDEEGKSKALRKLGESVFSQFGSKYRIIRIRTPNNMYLELEQRGDFKPKETLVN